MDFMFIQRISIFGVPLGINRDSETQQPKRCCRENVLGFTCVLAIWDLWMLVNVYFFVRFLVRPVQPNLHNGPVSCSYRTHLSLSILGTSKHLIFPEYLWEKIVDAKIFKKKFDKRKNVWYNINTVMLDCSVNKC